VAYARRRGYARPTFMGSPRPGDDRARERLGGYLAGETQHYPDLARRTVVAQRVPSAAQEPRRRLAFEVPRSR